MRTFLAIALLALQFPLIAIKQQAPIEFPDSIGAYTKSGCSITGVIQPAGNRHWHAVVWLDGAVSLPPGPDAPRWQRNYSVREQRIDAFKDCDRWMGELEKRTKRKK